MRPASEDFRGVECPSIASGCWGCPRRTNNFFALGFGAGMVKTAVISLLVCLTTGCVATVYPQQKILDPTVVYIADYGVHSGLLLPVGNGVFVEYAFGDWNYAALNHCGPQDGLGALLVSFQSALGRRFVNVEYGQEVPYPTHPAPQHLYPVYVSQSQVEQVVRELDDRYNRGNSAVVYNPDNLTSYVKDSEHYSVANNCNHLTARCLREMGCDVRGLVVTSNFTVAPVPVQTMPDPPQTAKTPDLGRQQSANAN
jgi:hypothetical protein